MVDGIPESGEGLFASLAEAKTRAAELQAADHETKIEESMFHLGQWVIYAAPREEA